MIQSHRPLAKDLTSTSSGWLLVVAIAITGFLGLVASLWWAAPMATESFACRTVFAGATGHDAS